MGDAGGGASAVGSVSQICDEAQMTIERGRSVYDAFFVRLKQVEQRCGTVRDNLDKAVFEHERAFSGLDRAVHAGEQQNVKG